MRLMRKFLARVSTLALVGLAVPLATLACSDPAESADAALDGPIADSGADANDPDAAVDGSADAPTDGPTIDAPGERYTSLSETGLYSNIVTKTLAPGVFEFAPAYVLWSDGAVKHRWVLLPEGEQVDTSDMDHWKFPVGTKFWKEFAITGTEGTIRIETRLIERLGETPDEVWTGAFEWNDPETEATFRKFGVINAKNTMHDIPSADACINCHAGEDGRILGFSAVQLSSGAAVNLTSLADDDLLSDPPPAGVDFPVPGTPTERAALGYLHANCGHCHNAEQAQVCFNTTGLSMRIYTGDTDADVEDTAVYLSAVDVPLTTWIEQGFTTRIVPGEPDESGLRFRMSTRAQGDQMPPIFTEIVDDDGVAAVDAWIESLD
jgi:hypothetical protein